MKLRNDGATARGVWTEPLTDYELYVQGAVRHIEKAAEHLTDACNLKARSGQDIVMSSRSADALMEAAQDLADVIRRINEG